MIVNSTNCFGSFYDRERKMDRIFLLVSDEEGKNREMWFLSYDQDKKDGSMIVDRIKYINEFDVCGDLPRNAYLKSDAYQFVEKFLRI